MKFDQQSKEKPKYSLGEAAGVMFLTALALPLFSIIVLPITIYCAWCDLHVWNWFGAPYFHLQPMSIWMAVGIGLWCSSVMRYGGGVKEDEPKIRWGATVLSALVSHGAMLGLAYLIHSRWL